MRSRVDDAESAVPRAGVRLGIDWGKTRIGVAACDAEGVLAYPVETVPQGETALDRLADLAAEYGAVEVVLGWPTDLRGRSGVATDAMSDIPARLAQVTGVAVRLLDERMTTVVAARQLASAGRRGSGRRAIIDQAAAVAILRQALDTERHTGRPAGHVVTAGEET